MYCDLAVSSSGLPRLFTRQALKMLGFGKVDDFLRSHLCLFVGGLVFADKVSNFFGIVGSHEGTNKVNVLERCKNNQG